MCTSLKIFTNQSVEATKISSDIRSSKEWISDFYGPGLGLKLSLSLAKLSSQAFVLLTLALASAQLRLG